jgi:hypothetical protein
MPKILSANVSLPVLPITIIGSARPSNVHRGEEDFIAFSCIFDWEF